MKKRYNIPEDYDDCEDDIIFDELQAAFDDQAKRITAILEQHADEFLKIDYDILKAYHREKLAAHVISVLVCISLAVAWGVTLPKYNYNLSFHILTIVIECVYLLLSLVSICRTMSLVRGFNTFRKELWKSRLNQLPRLDLKQLSIVGIATTVAIVLVANTPLFVTEPDAVAEEHLVYIIGKMSIS